MGRNFDAIVIGSGLGGLTAGGLCARAGLKVLVLERNEVFGGAATTFHHNGWSGREFPFGVQSVPKVR
jgi:all-trans-retinol 13,14-reductase